jgi:LysM repeat protein
MSGAVRGYSRGGGQRGRWAVGTLLVAWAALVVSGTASAAEPLPIATAAETAPEPPPLTYTVQPGDTLTHLARRYGVRLEALTYANGLADPNYIAIGQRLRIPTFADHGNRAATEGERKGLAMAVSERADRARLGVGWYYTWGWCTMPGCVPMMYAMERPPACPAWLLVGNEPNAVPPFGGPVSPDAAVDRVLGIEAACPQTRLVVGNVSADDWSPAGGWGSGRDWLRAFLEGYAHQAGRPFGQALGVHCYTRAAAGYCLDKLGELRALYTGPMWLTEFGVLTGDPEAFGQVLAYADANFDRFAAYTNRQPHTGQGWEVASGVELVYADGRLTPVGQAYADW